MSRPFIEGSKMKGGQNPNNTDDSRPPPPGGSGNTVQALEYQVSQLKAHLKEAHHNLRVCRERITEYRIRTHEAEYRAANAPQNAKRWQMLMQFMNSICVKQGLFNLLSVFEFTVPGVCDESLGETTQGKLQHLLDERIRSEEEKLKGKR